jgi:hypothetical protein
LLCDAHLQTSAQRGSIRMEGEDDAASAPSTDANTPNPASDDAAAAAGEEDLGGKWAAHKLAEATGSHSDLPDIMINGKVQKVTPRDHSKWNETGSSAMDDHTFRKLDEEVCESRLCPAAPVSRAPGAPQGPSDPLTTLPRVCSHG